MKLYYNSARNCFLDEHSQIPEGSVEVSEQIQNACMDAQATGKKFRPGPGGMPEIYDPALSIPLAEVKEYRKQEINTARDNALSNGFVFNGVIYDADEAAKTNVTGVVASVTAGIPLPADFTWRSKDNNNIPMDTETLLMFGAAFMANWQTILKRSWDLKDYISTRTTKKQVLAIDWDYTLPE